MISPALVQAFAKHAKKSDPSKFAGKKRLGISPEERRAFNSRMREAGLRSGGCGLAKTKAGFAAYTHRSRSSFHSHPSKIPLARLRFVESTG